MKLPGCACHFPLVEKCLCYSIFAFLFNKLEKLSGMQFKELCSVIFLFLLSGKKGLKPLLGPGLGDETPYRWKKVEQEGIEAGTFSTRPASLLKFLMRVKAWQGEMAGDGGAGCGLGQKRLLLETLMLGPYHPIPCRLCIERKKCAG